jgi:tRNA1(Val) A37 N6-methylase TrmN6
MSSKGKPDLIICDPPYFDKKSDEYAKESISSLSRQAYLKFLEKFFFFLKKISKKNTRIDFYKILLYNSNELIYYSS